MICLEDLAGSMERRRHREVARDGVLEPWVLTHLVDAHSPLGANLKHA